MPTRESSISASSYILTFFRDVEHVNDYVGHYNNLLLELKNKYGKMEAGDFIKKLDEGEKKTSKDIMQTMRFWVNRVYIKMAAMKPQIKKINEKWQVIEENAKKIRDEPVPKLEDVEKFAFSVNEVFVDATLKELLTRATEFYNEFVGEGEQNQ